MAEPGSGARVPVNLGTMRVKKKGSDAKVEVPAVGFAAIRVVDALDLKVMNGEEMVKFEGDDLKAIYRGARHGKRVITDNPGNAGKYLQFTVPQQMNIRDLAIVLAPTKTQRFSYGSGWYACKGESEQALKDTQAAAAAQSKGNKNRSGGS